MKEKGKKGKEAEKITWKTEEFGSVSSVFSPSSSPSVSHHFSPSKKNRGVFSLGAATPVTNSSHFPSHYVVTESSTSFPVTRPSSQAKIAGAATTSAAWPTAVPMPVPATTGHRWRRHHHQDNLLDLLYSTTLTGFPFVTFEILTVHHHQSPVPACSGTFFTCHCSCRADYNHYGPSLGLSPKE